MYLLWRLSVILFAEKSFALVAAAQSSFRDIVSADIFLSTVEGLGHSTSRGMPLLSRCSLDLFDLKKIDYNTIFDGAYGSEFTNVILTLCSDEGIQIPWNRNGRFEPSYLDQLAEQCCSDTINGLEDVSLMETESETESVGVPSPQRIFFLSASVCCMLFIVKFVYKCKGEQKP
jgi:hypothetical protein